MSRFTSVQRPNFAVLSVLVILAKRHGKGYCYPAQRTILYILAERFGLTMSKATLCRHLKRLEALGWISRQRRHQRAPDGSLEMHSTLYRLSREAFQSLAHNFGAAVDNFPKRVRLRMSHAVAQLRNNNVYPERISKYNTRHALRARRKGEEGG